MNRAHTATRIGSCQPLKAHGDGLLPVRPARNPAPNLFADGRRPVVFCDFDGTLTERDVVVMVMERFAPPQWRNMADAILEAKTVTLRDGIAQLFALLPSELAPAIDAFVRQQVVLRPGLDELLTLCDTHGIPFYVVSGGLDCLIRPVLQPYEGRYQLYCNQACWAGPSIGVAMPYLPQGHCDACNQCACCKVGVLQRYPATQWHRLVIGDGLTDWGMAQHADTVFARSSLARDMKQRGWPFHPFNCMAAVQRYLVANLV
jgi:2-hydroxy-3-keto-5-methylthiopentenyl-1-phosphate phosphatase